VRVAVTGGTGYLGAHAVAALTAEGHDVRLLVRDPRRLDDVLVPLGVDPPPHVVGDLADRAAVAELADGCDAALHCGGLVSLARRDAAEVVATNTTGAINVIDEGLAHGLDPVVHVSSVSALFTPGRGPVGPDDPIARWDSAYGRSKAAAEEHARRWQAEGAPVVISYPSGVTGPAAGPVLGAVTDSFASILRSGTMPLADVRVSYVDVRDVAAAHVRMLSPDRGPRRYVLGGHTLDGRAIASLLRDLTGRRLPALPIPGSVWRGLGRVVDLAARVLPFDPVFTHEAMVLSTRWRGVDDAATRADLGVDFRDPAETFRAAITALVDAGRLSARAAGAAA
jgi:UDP-glucose 4-epimerase